MRRVRPSYAAVDIDAKPHAQALSGNIEALFRLSLVNFDMSKPTMLRILDTVPSASRALTETWIDVLRGRSSRSMPFKTFNEVAQVSFAFCPPAPLCI
jgi:hypothetical protein